MQRYVAALRESARNAVTLSTIVGILLRFRKILLPSRLARIYNWLWVALSYGKLYKF